MKIAIALLDDEKAIRGLAREIFLRSAPTVDFRTFDLALDLFAEIERGYAPDVYLIDFLLRDMDCIEVLRRLEPMQAAGASVYIFTGHEEIVDAETLRRADGVISKSAAIRQLAAAVLQMEETRQVKAGTGINALAALEDRIIRLRAALQGGEPCPPAE